MPPRIRLDVIGGPEPIEVLQADSGVINIGREPENAIVVDSESVSRRHACLIEAGSFWVFRDLGSTNGSWVNGVQVVPEQTRLVRGNDTIQIADFPLRVVELQPVAQPIGPSLLLFVGERFQGEFQLTTSAPRIVFGGTGSDITLDEWDLPVADVVLGAGSGILQITVGDSATSVVVNGAVVHGAQELNDRDELEIGPYRAIIADNNIARNAVYLGSYSGSSAGGLAASLTEGSIIKGGTWSSDGEGKNRRFVFGQPSGEGGESEVSSTMPGYRFRQPGGYEASSSLRFSSHMNPSLEVGNGRAVNERFYVVIGFIVFVVLLVLVAYILLVR